MSEYPPPTPRDDRSRIYNGRYELIRQIARGGTAQVYLARDLLLDRPVALKVLFPELSGDPSFVERFRREAQAAANLSHPNIVPVFDWGESERTYFIVMEFVDGEPLSAIIKTQAPLPPPRAAGIAADISKALTYAHRHGVVHRDVKPGNVLITRDGQVKVTDFGIARAVGSDDNVTQTGLVMGTATYFSPEQAQGLGVDGRSDVYALGVVLYEMVTGKPPFSADTPVAIAYKHVSEQAVPPREIEPRIPESLEAVILRAIAKQPGERYPTAEDLHADLQRYAQGTPVLALAGGLRTGAISATTAMGTTEAGATQALAAGETVALPAELTTSRSGTTVLQHSELVGGVPRDPEMPKRRWIGWTVAAVILAALLALFVYVGGRELGYLGAPGFFSMPDVKSMGVHSADHLLGRDGLRVDDVPIYSRAPKGRVLHQHPGPLSTVQKDSLVTVVYSGGRRRVAVPAVVNETYTQAEKAIKAAGLRYRLVPVAPSPGETAGIVTKTDPKNGALMVPGSRVSIFYLHGAPRVSVPYVAGDTLSQADTALVSSRLTLRPTTYAPSRTAKQGLVAGTNPPAGSVEVAGAGVTVVISTGPPETVPNVTGDAQQQAVSVIESRDLVPAVAYVPAKGSQIGTVINQSPNPGTLLSKGATVTIDVGQQQGAPTTSSSSTSTSTSTSTTPGPGAGTRPHRRGHGMGRHPHR